MCKASMSVTDRNIFPVYQAWHRVFNKAWHRVFNTGTVYSTVTVYTAPSLAPCTWHVREYMDFNLVCW